jgi:hypothetical protein
MRDPRRLPDEELRRRIKAVTWLATLGLADQAWLEAAKEELTRRKRANSKQDSERSLWNTIMHAPDMRPSSLTAST